MFALASRDCFVHLFKGGARRVGEKTAFLFVNFFFGPIDSKKKWLKSFAVKTAAKAPTYNIAELLVAWMSSA